MILWKVLCGRSIPHLYLEQRKLLARLEREELGNMTMLFTSLISQKLSFHDHFPNTPSTLPTGASSVRPPSKCGFPSHINQEKAESGWVLVLAWHGGGVLEGFGGVVIA